MDADEVARITSQLHRVLTALFDAELNYMPAATRRFTVNGICRVVAAYQKSATLDIVQHSFERAGQYPFNVDKKIGETKYAYKASELENIRAKFDDLTKIMRENGAITEEQLDAVSVPNVRDNQKAPKDQRPSSRQRAQLLNLDPNLLRLQNQKKPVVVKSMNPVMPKRSYVRRVPPAPKSNITPVIAPAILESVPSVVPVAVPVSLAPPVIDPAASRGKTRKSPPSKVNAQNSPVKSLAKVARNGAPYVSRVRQHSDSSDTRSSTSPPASSNPDN